MSETAMIKVFWGDSEYNIIRNAGRGEYTIVGQAKEDISSLLRVIESQKAITEQINQDAKEVNDHYREVARGLWAGSDCPDIDQIAVKFKELSAITEIAVKGLKEVLNTTDWKSEPYMIAITALSAIGGINNGDRIS